MRKFSRQRNKALQPVELVAVVLGGMVGGMVGGGIFAILGVSVEDIGNATPITFFIGSILAFFAAYSYVKLSFSCS